MTANAPGIVALVGAGVVGRGWIRVFAPYAAEVRVYDPDPAQIAHTLNWLREDLGADIAEGFISTCERDRILHHVRGVSELAAALEHTDYVQESAPEQLASKKALFAELDTRAPLEAILASSSSALDVSEIARELPGANRCVIAHPFNPPHLIPVVEVLGSPRTDPAALARACHMLAACGQVPVRLNRYVPGFLGNRLQAALVREALHLVETGVADPIAVDAVIRDGLALRWATIGNFGANHSNADTGIAGYFARYADPFRALMKDLNSDPPRFNSEVLTAIADAVERREGVPDVAALCRKRDIMIKRLNQLKRAHQIPM
jgi:3-hydroxyacyl-CoA dehydrogenase